MSQHNADFEPYKIQLGKLYQDASYSAQAYFEAAKSAELLGKALVFAPALVGTITSFLIAIGGDKQWAALGAISSAIAATASFLGSDRKASSYKETARQLTRLRHEAGLELELADRRSSESELEEKLRSLRGDYSSITANVEPISNRLFQKAQKRISAGVLSYDRQKS